MSAQLANGWIVIPYDGHDLATVEFGVGDQFYPAFLSWIETSRVAQIRPPAMIKSGDMIQLLVNGIVLRDERYVG